MRTILSIMTGIIVAQSPCAGQAVDFETLPDGTPTFEGQAIYNQYEAVFGVTFTILDRGSGLPIGYPKIAEVGGEEYFAFVGCTANDTPLSGQGLGDAFLTEGVTGESPNDLLIEYAQPVSEASGVLIDVDRKDDGTYEEWTITALDSSGAVIGDPYVITAPSGPNPGCTNLLAGPGDGLAFGWQFSFATDQISAVRLHYTGTSVAGPVAFDNFSPSDPFPSPSASVTSSPWNKLCSGECADLLANVVGGTPPFTYQWEEETAPGVWTPIGDGPVHAVCPATTSNYRVTVTDADTRSATSDPFELAVCGPNADFNGDGAVDLDDFAVFQTLFTGPLP